MFDLPEPFGPTTAVMPGRNSKTVRVAKVLKPWISRRLRYTALYDLVRMNRFIIAYFVGQAGFPIAANSFRICMQPAGFAIGRKAPIRENLCHAYISSG